MTHQTDNFSGNWRSRFWYPTHDDKGEESTEYEMVAHQKGDEVVLQSMPGKSDSYMLVRLTVDGDVAMGSWQESTEPNGTYKGAMYNGAGALIISKDRQNMAGLWAGAGKDHAANKLKIYTGRWEFERIN
jgi:hypothetical protein